ncbi:MAG TPA: hypothetical protein DCQ98_07030 [Planctomycetaceae bacterium]|nr:hypothetical protein [Planctomycetaceae bacterium]
MALISPRSRQAGFDAERPVANPPRSSANRRSAGVVPAGHLVRRGDARSFAVVDRSERTPAFRLAASFRAIDPAAQVVETSRTL